MNRQVLQWQIESLEAYIKYGATVYTEMSGLCCNVLRIEFPSCVFETWSEFSGHIIFPVEGSCVAYSDNRKKHDRRTKYGKLRLSLAKHCLEWSINELRETV